MKKTGFISILMMTAGCIWMTTVSDNNLYAISGCCKQRPSVNDPWYRSSNDLAVCKDLNFNIDSNSDIVFNESGKVWWDLSC